VTIETISAFLDTIGIPVIEGPLPGPTFLPGLTMCGGAVLYDRALLEYPGDLLHEAGHVAFTPAAERAALTPESSFDLGDDHAAIAWSYAAALQIGIDPKIVFHAGGYQGNSPAFIANFAKRQYVGVPLLEWAGLTTFSEFPSMRKWLRG